MEVVVFAVLASLCPAEARGLAEASMTGPSIIVVQWICVCAVASIPFRMKVKVIICDDRVISLRLCFYSQ